MRIFLDDIRQPADCLPYMYRRIGKNNLLYMDDWIVVRNFDEFTTAISENYGEIEFVSFDHDLSLEHYMDGDIGKIKDDYKEKTGADCARWMKEFYKSKKQPLPTCFVHSMNPIGTERIINILHEQNHDDDTE